MQSWLAWLGTGIAAVLLPIVAVLLYRVLRGKPQRPPAGPVKGYVATTPDETMVISRQQADEMLNK